MLPKHRPPHGLCTMNLEVALCAKDLVPGSLLHPREASNARAGGPAAGASRSAWLTREVVEPVLCSTLPSDRDARRSSTSERRMVDPKPRLDAALSDLTCESCDAAGEHYLGQQPVHP